MNRKTVLLILAAVSLAGFSYVKQWQSKFVIVNKDGSLTYIPDEKGNVIPDFSRVGYYNGDKEIPNIAIVKTIVPSPNAESNSKCYKRIIQATHGQKWFQGCGIIKERHLYHQ